MKYSKLFLAVSYLSFIGVLLAVYLLWEQFFHPAFQPCNINSFINCNAIISGAVANTLGIPTPIYGLIGYIVLMIAGLMHQKKLILGTASFGLVFCLYIAFRELVQLRVICPVCITCQVVMISVFTIGVILIHRKD